VGRGEGPSAPGDCAGPTAMGTDAKKIDAPCKRIDPGSQVSCASRDPGRDAQQQEVLGVQSPPKLLSKKSMRSSRYCCCATSAQRGGNKAARLAVADVLYPGPIAPR
jgi:hypothetical protein